MTSGSIQPIRTLERMPTLTYRVFHLGRLSCLECRERVLSTVGVRNSKDLRPAAAWLPARDWLALAKRALAALAFASGGAGGLVF